MTSSIDDEMIDRITKLAFENTTNARKVEVLKELLVIRNFLYKEGNLEYKASSQTTQPEPTPSPQEDPKNEDYCSREKRKTWEALERIYKKDIISKEEAEKIFNKIYNSDNK